MFTIPTVDISEYIREPNSSKAADIVSEIRSACISSGFFQITGHGVSQQLQQAVLTCARTFFALPQEEKEKLKSANGRGYEQIGAQTLGAGMKPDLKEGYYVGPEIPHDKESYQDFRYPNKWPDESLIAVKDFKDPMLEYHRRLCSLSGVLMEILGKGLPYETEAVFEAFSTDPLAVLRILHYPPQKDLLDPKAVGAGAHTDFGAITLLLQDDKGGLQVLNQSSGEWIDVEPNPEAYVVNTGDMLQMWTKGEYRSNVHRVINRSGGDRYSVPFFFDGNLDVVLGPLDGSQTDDGGITVEQFMKERYAKTYGS